MKINLNTIIDFNQIKKGDILVMASGAVRMIVYGNGEYSALDLEDGVMCCMHSNNIEEIIKYYQSISTIVRVIKKDNVELKEIK